MCSIVAFRRKGRNWSVTTTKKEPMQWNDGTMHPILTMASQQIKHTEGKKRTCVTLYSTRGPIIIQSKEVLYIYGKKGKTSTELVILLRKKIIYVYKNFAQRTGNRTGWHYDVLFYFSLKCSIALFLLDRKVFAPEKKNQQRNKNQYAMVVKVKSKMSRQIVKINWRSTI